MSLTQTTVVSCSLVFVDSLLRHILGKLIAVPEILTLTAECLPVHSALYSATNHLGLDIAHFIVYFFTWDLLEMMDQPFSTLCPNSFISLYLKVFNLYTFISRSFSHHTPIRWCPLLAALTGLCLLKIIPDCHTTCYLMVTYLHV